MTASSVTLHFDDVTLRMGDFTLSTGQVQLEEGSVTALLGANGSGKSTVLRLGAGLLVPQQGRVLLRDQPLAAWRESQRARAVAYVPQRPLVGAPFTVRQVVELGRHALSPRPDQVREALQQVGLLHRAEEPFQRLSVGQQQRVAFARALAQHEPGGIILLDEVCSAIDLPETSRMVHLIRQLAGRGATVLLATHDLTLAAAVADRVWYLEQGATTALGGVSQVLEPGGLASLTGLPIVVAEGNRGALPVPDLTAILPPRP